MCGTREIANIGNLFFFRGAKSRANAKKSGSRTTKFCSLISEVSQEPMRTVSPRLPLTPGSYRLRAKTPTDNTALGVK